ncbi:cellulose binding domain-containing protein [Rhodothermus sp. AH-315-K08]|nr:cellulose binding domain-containing protein [Rhodothermus sp. AH-315-K08]
MRAYAVARTALLTLLILVLASLPGLTTDARAFASPDDPSGHVRVIYFVDQTLGAAYVSTVMITNMTASPIQDWTMQFDLNPPADNIRSAQFSVSGTTHQVSGAGWTRTIEVGEAVWFSIDGTIPSNGIMDDVNSVPRPTNCVFQGETCSFEEISGPAPNPQDTLAVDIGWWVASQGVTQFRAQILMQNFSDERVDFWTLRFRSTSLITKIEHGDWTRSGSNYEVTGRGWTRSIDPGETIFLTLSGVHGGQVDTLESCIFNGFPCSFVDPDDFVDAPEEPLPVGGLCAVQPAGASTGRARITSSMIPRNGTFHIDMGIFNVGSGALRDWEFSFEIPTNMTIKDFWPVNHSRVGRVVKVSPKPWNTCLEPGDGVIIGIEGTWDGAGPEPPTKCMVDGEPCELGRFRIVSTGVDDDPALTQPGAEFELEAPYPNPFATDTNIPFRVSETQHVTVTLWDMQGRRVGFLFDGTAIAGQAYRINVPAGTLHSGAYMVRLVGASGLGVSTPILLVR